MGGQVFIIFIISVILNFGNCSLILTPYIKENRIDDARNFSRVDPQLFLGIESHSGFLTVDEKYDSNTFFWYFPVPNKPVNETPWIIWLQGGPGATSLFGLFEEIGPLYFRDTLKKRQWSWGNEYSLLFIDNPIGAGYSFTKSDEGYATNMDMYGKHLLTAVNQFLRIFPELKQAPLFLAGESYAGRFVPALADQIHTHTSPNEINLKGLILGNPVLERESILNLSSTFYNWGLIDSQGLAAAKPLQEAYNKAVYSKDNEEADQKRNELLDFLQDKSRQPQTYNMLQNDLDLTKFQEFLTPNIEEAIHVRTNGVSKSNDLHLTNNIIHNKLLPDFNVHVRPIIEKLLDHYKMLIYCGQLDLTTPCTLNAEARRKTWHWAQKDKFMEAMRVPWLINGSVVGYVKSGGGFTEVLVRGAGHLAPIDKPEVTYNLIKNFIDAKPFSKDDLKKEIFTAELEEELPSVNKNTIALIISLIANVVLVTGVCFWFVRRRLKKSQTLEDDWLYQPVDDTVGNNILQIV